MEPARLDRYPDDNLRRLVSELALFRTPGADGHLGSRPAPRSEGDGAQFPANRAG